jgi:hypothetical protein
MNDVFNIHDKFSSFATHGEATCSGIFWKARLAQPFVRLKFYFLLLAQITVHGIALMGHS